MNNLELMSSDENILRIMNVCTCECSDIHLGRDNPINKLGRTISNLQLKLTDKNVIYVYFFHTLYGRTYHEPFWKVL